MLCWQQGQRLAVSLVRRAGTSALRGVVSPDVKRVAYVTDVEGNWAYFVRAAQASPVLSLAGGTPERVRRIQREDGMGSLEEGVAAVESISPDALELADDGALVFGGDVFDRGIGDTTCLEALLSLRRRYPGRVFWTLGNRDINKARLASELLDPAELARDPDQIGGPYWVPKMFRVPWALHAARSGYAAGAPELHDPYTRLDYILKRTMGCDQRTLDHRRIELAARSSSPSRLDLVSNDDLVRSFSDLVAPSEDSPYAQYLDAGSAVLRIGNALFVHGAIDELCLSSTPQEIAYTHGVPKASDDPYSTFPPDVTWSPKKPLDEIDVDAWIGATNDWLHAGFRDWLASPFYDKDRVTRGGEGFIGYANQACMAGRTVVYNNWLINGAPVPPGRRLAAALADQGIHRIFSGHQPFGDHPLVLKQGPLTVLAADTSYSDVSAYDNRGAAVAAVTIHLDSETTHVSGVLADGSQYEYDTQSNPRVGSTVQTKHGNAYITAKLTHRRPAYIARTGTGFNVHTSYLRDQE